MDLHRLPLLNDLSEPEIGIINDISVLKEYHAGNVLFYEGDDSVKLHYLTEGIAKVYKIDKNGNELVIHYVSGPSLIGELANLENFPFPASCVIESDAKVLIIDYAAFKDKLLSRQEVCYQLLKSLCKKVKHLEDLINFNLTMDSTSKFAKFICENETILHTIKHKKIASILNTSPETVSRIVARFKKEGILKPDSKEIIILDKTQLKSHFGN